MTPAERICELEEEVRQLRGQLRSLLSFKPTRGAELGLTNSEAAALRAISLTGQIETSRLAGVLHALNGKDTLDPKAGARVVVAKLRNKVRKVGVEIKGRAYAGYWIEPAGLAKLKAERLI